MKVELAILNYNGRHHLEHLLPTAIQEASTCRSNCCVVVLDNGSSMGELNWISSTFPTVHVVSAPANDYLFSYNWYAQQTEAEILVFLNNDLKLCSGFLAPLLAHFSRTDVFSVSATSRNWEDTFFTFGPIQLKNHHGAWYWQPEFAKQKTSPTLFTSGGFMAVDRKKFLEIGGFDRLYYPAYCEDLDLCFRAWKNRWRCIFEPKSIVLHRENGSWAKNGNDRASYLQTRGGWLFVWKNLPNSSDFWERIAYFMLQLASSLVSRKIWFYMAWLDANRIWLTLPCSSKQERVSLKFLKKLKSLLE